MGASVVRVSGVRLIIEVGCDEAAARYPYLPRQPLARVTAPLTHGLLNEQNSLRHRTMRYQASVGLQMSAGESRWTI